MNEALVLRLITAAELTTLLTRYPGRRTAQLTPEQGATRSHLEDDFIRFLKRHRPPTPRAQPDHRRPRSRRRLPRTETRHRTRQPPIPHHPQSLRNRTATATLTSSMRGSQRSASPTTASSTTQPTRRNDSDSILATADPARVSDLELRPHLGAQRVDERVELGVVRARPAAPRRAPPPARAAAGSSGGSSRATTRQALAATASVNESSPGARGRRSSQVLGDGLEQLGRVRARPGASGVGAGGGRSPASSASRSHSASQVRRPIIARSSERSTPLRCRSACSTQMTAQRALPQTSHQRSSSSVTAPPARRGVGGEQLLARAAAQRRLGGAEAPRPHAHPAEVLGAVAGVDELPVDQRRRAVLGDDEVGEPEVAVHDRGRRRRRAGAGAASAGRARSRDAARRSGRGGARASRRRPRPAQPGDVRAPSRRPRAPARAGGSRAARSRAAGRRPPPRARPAPTRAPRPALVAEQAPRPRLARPPARRRCPDGVSATGSGDRHAAVARELQHPPLARPHDVAVDRPSG